VRGGGGARGGVRWRRAPPGRGPPPRPCCSSPMLAFAASGPAPRGPLGTPGAPTCRGGPADPASRAQCVAPSALEPNALEPNALEPSALEPSALEPSGPGSAGGRAPVVSRAQVHEERGHVAVPHPAEALRSAQRRRTRTLQRFAALGGQARYPAEVDVRD